MTINNQELGKILSSCKTQLELIVEIEKINKNIQLSRSNFFFIMGVAYNLPKGGEL